MGDSVDLNRLMWLGAGAGSKGVLAGMVSGLAPEASITPDIASLFLGLWLSHQSGNVGTFGEGVLVASVGQLVKEPIEGVFGKLSKKTASTSGATEGALARAARQRALEAGATDIDSYTMQKYGV